jgi:hypothetical protein
MILIYIAFALLLIAGLYLGEIRLVEAVAYVAFLILLTLTVAFRWHVAIFVSASVLVDIVLILRIFKGDISLR